jgi:Pyridoxamine 5'-phosphate oxidase
VASWKEFEANAPELARAIKARFDAHRHKLLATLRRDGSPRISGCEVTFADGELWMGMMPDSRKALDLRRDPRLALHSGSLDLDMAEGDAKISGRAEEITDQRDLNRYRRAVGGIPPGPFHLFRVDVTEAVLTRVGDPRDHLVIESWRPHEGVRRTERR